MYINIDMSTKKPQSAWLWHCLIATVIMIGCMASYGTQASESMRGIEYVNISLQQLVSIFKEDHQLAGFEVATITGKDDDQKTIEIILRMRFSLPGYPKKYKEVHTVSIYSDWGSEDLSSICDPCEVIEDRLAWGENPKDIRDQTQQALDYAYSQIDKDLSRHIKRDSTDRHVIDNDQMSVLEFVSVYKQAYAELGFELREMTAQSENGNGEIRFLTFSYKKPDPYGGIGISILWLNSSNSSWCHPCYAVRKNNFNVVMNPMSEKQGKEASEGYLNHDDTLTAQWNFHRELEGIDSKARALAAEKLAKYSR